MCSLNFNPIQTATDQLLAKIRKLKATSTLKYLKTWSKFYQIRHYKYGNNYWMCKILHKFRLKSIKFSLSNRNLYCNKLNGLTPILKIMWLIVSPIWSLSIISKIGHLIQMTWLKEVLGLPSIEIRLKGQIRNNFRLPMKWGIQRKEVVQRHQALWENGIFRITVK